MIVEMRPRVDESAERIEKSITEIGAEKAELMRKADAKFVPCETTIGVMYMSSKVMCEEDSDRLLLGCIEGRITTDEQLMHMFKVVKDFKRSLGLTSETPLHEYIAEMNRAKMKIAQ